MKGLRSALALAGLVGVACGGTTGPGASRRALTPIDLPAFTTCAAGDDADRDGTSDACELGFASAFAPILLQDPADCEWRGGARDGRIAGGYLHVVEQSDSARVRVAYLPAYLTDCGWHGAKCILPRVDCDAHAGDSELIVVDAQKAHGVWQPVGVFLSGHCFDGESRECRWHRNEDLRALDWDGARPVVWVSAGRHANYPSRAACERGHYHLDTCDFEPLRVDFPIDAERNLGSAASPARGGCLPAPLEAADRTTPAAEECIWSASSFRGWQPAEPGITPYRRYLDEIAGFVSPIDRLAWLAGCWERRSDDSLLEEQWMAPRGGTMLGMSRVIRAGATVAHEAMRIEERDSLLVFVANPSGQAQADFTATTVEDDVVVFENREHDFPQRVVYRHAAPDSLHARIEGVSDGAEESVDFRMGRVDCESQ